MVTIEPMTCGAVGIGLATIAADGSTLDTWYPAPRLVDGADRHDDDHARTSSIAEPDQLEQQLLAAERHDDVREVRIVVTRTEIESLTEPPADVADAYLRLHLLSARLAKPGSINVEGIFAMLPNNAWTTLGPVAASDVTATQLRARTAGMPIQIYGVDRFPRMVDYVVPSGVRIADADRVRLGAHLASGTVVMHEGFCNFNAGTLGASMIEGRISQGVLVGDGSDIGGSASMMGTLSGGGTVKVSIGERCLIGANAGIGIPLGDDCVVEAGLYLTAGTKVAVLADDERTVMAARELAGVSGLLFRRHSLTGEVQAVPHIGSWHGLNAALHAAD